ncbi:hypothetical protein LTSEMON_1230 [Salmonella enterica subsp. enterica serovar Montevideo str. S5-403]|uniref:Uncharacterized protein n=1 Tax=Salmonella enterica subsp. enterica serovar Montevideo str. S5-403 TaxID=913242 RepID=G5Q0B9_SALMO|nr:hypothetical protein LTSEMON_1230 [Salmonella enterica subsp. enterica serovar Montevideo str. S5-403]
MHVQGAFRAAGHPEIGLLFFTLPGAVASLFFTLPGAVADAR